jgi:hypothetical protein
MERLYRCSHCQFEIRITTAQAGSQIVCSSCGATNQIPTLRGMAELPLVGDASQQVSAESAKQSRWRWRGPLMAACVAVLLVSGVFSLYFFRNWYSVDTSRDVDAHIKSLTEMVEKTSADELIQVWDDYSKVSLRKPAPPTYKLLNNWAASNLQYGQISLLIALLMAVGIFFLGIGGKSG